MDQETRWLTKYKEVMEFIERCHRNPSRHRIEEHDMLNWVKANRKRMNAGELKEPQFDFIHFYLLEDHVDLWSKCGASEEVW